MENHILEQITIVIKIIIRYDRKRERRKNHYQKPLSICLLFFYCKDIIMFNNILITFVIAMIIAITIISIRISFGQLSDTIEIKALLNKDDFIASSLHFQKASLIFGNGSNICPENNCSYEFERTTFDERFGAANTKYLSGTLQIEDKADTNGNFISYRYYRLSGTFNPVNGKENIKTGDKILIYEGYLLLDTGNAMFSHSKVEYKCEIKFYYLQNKLELYGKINNPSTNIN